MLRRTVKPTTTTKSPIANLDEAGGPVTVRPRLLAISLTHHHANHTRANAVRGLWLKASPTFPVSKS